MVSAQQLQVMGLGAWLSFLHHVNGSNLCLSCVNDFSNQVIEARRVEQEMFNSTRLGWARSIAGGLKASFRGGWLARD